MGIPIISIISILHLIFVATWGGIVMTESVLEIVAKKKNENLKSISVFHYWIDLLVELPVIMAVLATGVALFILTESITILHIVKISFAVMAILANLYCIYNVIKRYQAVHSGECRDTLLKKTNPVMLSGIIGIPIGIIVFSIGLWIAYHRIAEMIG